MTEIMALAKGDSRISTQEKMPPVLKLDLEIGDPDVVQELFKVPEGSPRQARALTALRIGILAIRQASGVIDGLEVRREGDRLLAQVREFLNANAVAFQNSLTTALKQYFDPSTGHLDQRLDRLLKKEGELERVLRQHVGGDMSTLAQTLAAQVGEKSPIFRLLSPEQADGVLAAMKSAIEAELQAQREAILKQFSLDDKDTVISRLIVQITDANAKLKNGLAEDLEAVRGEFSLDNPNGALSRLVQHFSPENADSAISKMARLLEATNGKIEESLSLDKENSPFYRLRRELLQVIETQGKAQNLFYADVRAALAAEKAREQEAARSTRHGGVFEDAVGELVQQEAQRTRDVFEATGKTLGHVPDCKVGDHAITLGDDSAAPGQRIVVEAKEDKSYKKVRDALDELQVARDNRQAQVGIFVFSRLSAPKGIEPLTRYGQDIVVVWDREDDTTDVYLKAAISVARAVISRAAVAKEKSDVDFTVVDNAVLAIAADAKALAEIGTWAKTIKNNGEKIIERAVELKVDFEKQVGLLNEHLGLIKAEVAE
jgi:hypothetical protein